MSVNINHQLEQVNNLKITTVGTGATVGSAGIVTYYGDGSERLVSLLVVVLLG